MSDLIGDHTQSKRMLKLRYAPRLTGDNLLMTRSDQEQIRHHGDAKGLLNPVFMATNLVFAQPQARFEFPVHEFNGMITNDKFCCTRWSQLQLSWWRRPLRLRS